MTGGAVRSDYVLSLVSKGFVAMVGVVSSAMLTRYLGVGLRGDYAFLLQVSGILVLLFDGGASQTYSYFYRRYQGQVLAKSVRIYISHFYLMLAAAIAVAALVDNEMYRLAALLVPFGVLRARLESTTSVENIRLKIKTQTWVPIVSLVGFAALLLASGDSDGALWPPVAVILGTHLLVVRSYAPAIGLSPIPRGVDCSYGKEVLRFSWIPMLTTLLGTLNYSVDIVLLKYLGSGTELSLYSVAAGIMTYVWLIPDTFKEVLVSRVARADSITSVNLALKLSCLISIGVMGVFALAGETVITVLYGEEFLGAYGAALVLFPGVMSMVFYKIIGVLFLAEGRRRFYFWVLTTGVIANVLMNVWAIPRWGMYGAAAASVLSYSICGIAFLVHYLNVKGVRLLDVTVLSRAEMKYVLSRIGG